METCMDVNKIHQINDFYDPRVACNPCMRKCWTTKSFALHRNGRSLSCETWDVSCCCACVSYFMSGRKCSVFETFKFLLNYHNLLKEWWKFINYSEIPNSAHVWWLHWTGPRILSMERLCKRAQFPHSSLVTVPRNWPLAFQTNLNAYRGILWWWTLHVRDTRSQQTFYFSSSKFFPAQPVRWDTRLEFNICHSKHRRVHIPHA